MNLSYQILSRVRMWTKALFIFESEKRENLVSTLQSSAAALNKDRVLTLSLSCSQRPSCLGITTPVAMVSSSNNTTPISSSKADMGELSCIARG